MRTFLDVVVESKGMYIRISYNGTMYTCELMDVERNKVHVVTYATCIQEAMEELNYATMEVYNV